MPKWKNGLQRAIMDRIKVINEATDDGTSTIDFTTAYQNIARKYYRPGHNRMVEVNRFTRDQGLYFQFPE